MSEHPTIPKSAWFIDGFVYCYHYNGEWSIHPNNVWRPYVKYTSYPVVMFKQRHQYNMVKRTWQRPDWKHNKNLRSPIEEKPAAKTGECVCSMTALWDGGCPANRGLTCKSI